MRLFGAERLVWIDSHRTKGGHAARQQHGAERLEVQKIKRSLGKLEACVGQGSRMAPVAVISTR